jgi:hypothetical protein
LGSSGTAGVDPHHKHHPRELLYSMRGVLSQNKKIPALFLQANEGFRKGLVDGYQVRRLRGEERVRRISQQASVGGHSLWL